MLENKLTYIGPVVAALLTSSCAHKLPGHEEGLIKPPTEVCSSAVAKKDGTTNSITIFYRNDGTDESMRKNDMIIDQNGKIMHGFYIIDRKGRRYVWQKGSEDMLEMNTPDFGGSDLYSNVMPVYKANVKKLGGKLKCIPGAAMYPGMFVTPENMNITILNLPTVK